MSMDLAAPSVGTLEAAAQGHRSAFADFLRVLLRTSSGRVGVGIILLVVLMALGAPVAAPYSPIAVNPANRLTPPSLAHLMGTDELGRDVLSRVLFGSQISLQVGVVSVSIAAVLGVLIGLSAGFYGGRLDLLVMRIVDVMQAFPGFLLALAIVAMLGPSLPNAMIAVGVGEAPGYARLVRGSVLSIKNQDYVLAARVLGASNFQIMRTAVLPNVLAPIVVLATLGFPVAVLAAAALSFVGLGAQPPSPEWGAMIVSGRNFITNAPWLINFPGLAIFVTVLGFNLFGNAVRDALDPRLRQR
ncbi:MAG: ABC transporter permease [Chloroflexi bacterium]|nr:ABC transporter permease [Chloroflexota bacterium]MBV9543988.1 ABC transporter permease [Chloroflexota bacterium]